MAMRGQLNKSCGQLSIHTRVEHVRSDYIMEEQMVDLKVLKEKAAIVAAKKASERSEEAAYNAALAEYEAEMESLVDSAVLAKRAEIVAEEAAKFTGRAVAQSIKNNEREQLICALTPMVEKYQRQTKELSRLSANKDSLLRGQKVIEAAFVDAGLKQQDAREMPEYLDLVEKVRAVDADIYALTNRKRELFNKSIGKVKALVAVGLGWPAELDTLVKDVIKHLDMAKERKAKEAAERARKAKAAETREEIRKATHVDSSFKVNKQLAEKLQGLNKH